MPSRARAEGCCARAEVRRWKTEAPKARRRTYNSSHIGSCAMKRFRRQMGLKTRLHMAAFVVLLHATGAFADEIKVLSSVGIKAVVDELAPQFEKATKHKVTTVFGLAGALKTQIEGGESFDVAILTPPLLDDLIAKGRVSSKSTVARTGLGLMIKAGAHKPDVGTVDAFKRTLLAAKSITFASAGASG